jgi:hypothetical protein
MVLIKCCELLNAFSFIKSNFRFLDLNKYKRYNIIPLNCPKKSNVELDLYKIIQR